MPAFKHSGRRWSIGVIARSCGSIGIGIGIDTVHLKSELLAYGVPRMGRVVLNPVGSVTFMS